MYCNVRHNPNELMVHYPIVRQRLRHCFSDVDCQFKNVCERGAMGIVVIIDGREAIPVRAIPFVAGWMISPDVVARTFAKTDHWITRLEGVAAHYLSVEGKYSPMLAKEWDGIEADLQILSDKLKATEEVEQENYPVWRQQSILRLPASCFVWRDEFEEAFRRSYSTDRLILLDERPGDRELNFSPRISEELALAVMQGFGVTQCNNASSSVDKLKQNVGMAESTPALFVSLATALEGWFDKPKDELPDELRQRVETDFSPMPWDALSPDQRRSVAAQWDFRHDPAMENERQYWWDFYILMDDLKKQIEQWSAIATPTATDLAQKETRLVELQRELANMKKEEKQPYRKPADLQRNSNGKQASVTTNSAGKPEYIAYPKAMKLLAERLDATPEELAAWLFSGPGPGLGGLTAYQNANELDPPPRFYYANYDGNFDYLAPLMSCWFIAEEIANFQPTERYITGKALIERWSEQPSIQPKAYILAKIAESRLMDCHPIYGGTEATFSGMGSFPPLETGLFALSHIEEIEASDFGNEAEANVSINLKPSVSASEIRWKFTVVKSEDANDQWWKKMMSNASDNGLKECRVGEGRKGYGGSLWRPDLIAVWLVERTDKKLEENMSKNSARAALKKFSGYEDTAEELFPSDE